MNTLICTDEINFHNSHLRGDFSHFTKLISGSRYTNVRVWLFLCTCFHSFSRSRCCQRSSDTANSYVRDCSRPADPWPARWVDYLFCHSAPVMGYERFILWFWESPTCWHECKVKKLFYCLIKCYYIYRMCSTTPKQLAQWFIFPNPSFAWR